MQLLRGEPHLFSAQFQVYRTAEEAVKALISLYETAIAQGLLGDVAYYPCLAFHVGSRRAPLGPGWYVTTVTHPQLFEAYYREQIQHMMDACSCQASVGFSSVRIPSVFLHETAKASRSPAYHTRDSLSEADPVQNADIPNQVPLNLAWVTDAIANGQPLCHRCTHDDTIYPLSLFTAERTDYSLNRLYHYSGTQPRFFQRFVILVNYQRYIKMFLEYGLERLKEGLYTAIVEPGNRVTQDPTIGFEPCTDHMPQMPAYHLIRPDGDGITLINIGVSPSNAKTMTDHLAVLRPQAWVMLGHCAGLHAAQELGDYVLADGYVRQDYVLDHDLPLGVPVPAVSGVQKAFLQAAKEQGEGVHQGSTYERTLDHGRLAPFPQAVHPDLRQRLRLGVVFSTSNRNWELRLPYFSPLLNLSRALAVDMESATVAANGFRFRVPYGAFLCVSDKPFHGEAKLRAMAKRFYQERSAPHLRIALRAMELMREQGLSSDELRGFREPPFR